MLNKTSDEVLALFEERGVMGIVENTLCKSQTPRTKGNYDQLKSEMLSLAPGPITSDELQQVLKKWLPEEEVVLTVFKKDKKDGRIGGYKRGYKNGFSYDVKSGPQRLARVYLHWDQEKHFLLDNIKGLQNESVWIEVRGIEMKNIFWFVIQLFHAEEKSVLKAEISLYLGYQV